MFTGQHKLIQICKAPIFQYIFFFKGEENVYVPVESRYIFYRAQIELIRKNKYNKLIFTKVKNFAL